MPFAVFRSGSEVSDPNRLLLRLYFFLRIRARNRGIQSIYLHHSGPLLEMALTGQRIYMVGMVFPCFYSISISTVGVDGGRVCLWRFSFLAFWVVVVDSSQFPAGAAMIGGCFTIGWGDVKTTAPNRPQTPAATFEYNSCRNDLLPVLLNFSVSFAARSSSAAALC